MGNFKGHAFPGTMMLIAGLFYFLRSSNVSFLRNLRTKQFWISAEAVSFAFYGALGCILEVLDAAITKNGLDFNFAQSHWDHIRITGMVCISGIVGLLHQYNLLTSAGWGFSIPAGIAYVGLLFNSHHQLNDLQSLGHWITGVLFWLFALSRAMEFLVGHYSNQKYLAACEKLADQYINKQKQFSKVFYVLDIPNYFCFFCSRRKNWRVCQRTNDQESEEILGGINPAYHNPNIYRSVLPIVSAFLMFLNGVWWWEMAISYYINWDDIPSKYKNGPMARHYAYGDQLYRLVAWVVAFFVAVMLIMEFVDRYWFKKKRDHLRKQGDIPDGVMNDYEGDVEEQMFALKPQSHENSDLAEL